MLKNEKEIREKFWDTFNEVSDSSENFKFNFENSSSVITIKKIENNKRLFSMDIAISDKEDRIIVFNKEKNQFVRNQRRDYQEKTDYLKKIKKSGNFEEFRQKYFKLKNQQKNSKSSILILLDLINEYKQKLE